MMPQINLIHLKFFCDAVRYGSISEAAKMNYVTQSTISQAITKLERILSAELVSHGRQKFNITDEGKIVYERARHVFKSVQNIHDHLNKQKTEISGALNFVSTNSLGMSFLAPLYRDMQIQFPAINLHFQLGGLNFIRNAMRQGEADFAIVVYDNSFAQFNKHILKKGFFHLYQRSDTPPDAIENGILVDHLEGMHVAALQNYFLETQKSELKIQTALCGWEVVARFVDMHIGVGFFPDYLIEHGRYPYLEAIRLEMPAFEYEICAIYNKGEKPSRAAEAFFEYFNTGKD